MQLQRTTRLGGDTQQQRLFCGYGRRSTAFSEQIRPLPFLALTKVFQGLLMVKAEHADTKDKFLRLWCHEESRVFRDRLISAEDRTWFNNALQVTVSIPGDTPKHRFPTNALEIVERPAHPRTNEQLLVRGTCYFSSSTAGFGGKGKEGQFWPESEAVRHYVECVRRCMVRE